MLYMALSEEKTNMKTIQTNNSISTDTFQTLEPVQLETIQGGGWVGVAAKIIGKGAGKAKQAWPAVKTKGAQAAKFVGANAAAGLIGDAAVGGYNWARDKVTGGH